MLNKKQLIQKVLKLTNVCNHIKAALVFVHQVTPRSDPIHQTKLEFQPDQTGI